MGSLRDSEAELASALRRLEGHTAYAEVMAESGRGARLRMDKAATSPELFPRLTGAAFRAWNGSAWAETAATNLTKAGLGAAVDALRSRLPSSALGQGPPGESTTGSAERMTPTKRPLDDVTLEDMRARAKTVFDWALAVPGISNAIVGLTQSQDERLFLSTAGARRYQRVSRTHVSLAPIAIANGKVEYDFVSIGRTAGSEVWDDVTEELATKTAQESVALLNAAAAPSGRMTVLLDPGTAGTFAHESFGHGTEADQLLRDRSYLKPLLGQVVGPECLTLVDDGSFDGGWGSIYFDDEGHPSQRNVLVDHGRFVEVLHDRESAAAMRRQPTGNTRRADFLSRPFVRMTNTFIEPGDRSFDDLVADVKDGVLLETCTSGIEDPLGGNMQIKVKKGHRIVHGEVGEILPSMALSGRVLEFLRSIRGVGRKDAFEMSPGFCGKGHTDLLPAGTGGTYLVAEAVVGPG